LHQLKLKAEEQSIITETEGHSTSRQPYIVRY